MKNRLKCIYFVDAAAYFDYKKCRSTYEKNDTIKSSHSKGTRILSKIKQNDSMIKKMD